MKVKNSNFKKGSVEMLLLHILNTKGDCYGYQMTQLIKQISEDVLDFPEGSMYPALYKLMDHSFISDYKKQVGKRLMRVYYHIEESGVQHLAALKEDYFRTSLAIQKVLEHDFSMDEEDEQKDEQ